MKGKVIGVFVCMLMIASVFGNINTIKAEAIIELDAPEASHTEVLNILKDKTHTQLYEITKTKKLKKRGE